MNPDIRNTRVEGDSLSRRELGIWDVFQQRRSVRKYKPDSVPMEDILKIIDAARMAPTSGNQQPWKFLIVTDKNKINEMKDACIKGTMESLKKNKKEMDASKKEEITNMFNNYFSAPVYIIILTDNNSIYSSYNHWDGPLAAGYLLLAARALGCGTVFITDAIPESVTKAVFHIPDNYTRVCITPVGIPVEWPPTPKKKQLQEFITNEIF
jgi:nitroreductase